VDHGINGFICHDEKDWFENLLLILSNHQLLVDMGQRTRKKIVDHYSVKSNAANFLNLFH
jgi:glycosyltransferase involved in cell wall biosynthesis